MRVKDIPYGAYLRFPLCGCQGTFRPSQGTVVILETNVRCAVHKEMTWAYLLDDDITVDVDCLTTELLWD